MTIYDISQKAGVSIATVSRVLNGKENVSEATREKVKAVMDEYGYTPNMFARGLGLNTANTIGVLCVDSSDIFLAKAIYNIENLLRDNGYGCLLCCTGYERSNIQSYLNLLLSKKVDAVIFIGSSLIGSTAEENAHILEAAKEVPIFLLNASLDAPNIYSILADDYHAMYQATEKLIKSGIKDILYFHNKDSYSGRKKLQGYKDAMAYYGITQTKSLISLYKGDHEDLQAMKAQLNAIKDNGVSFHGIVASDDFMAMAGVQYARSCGYKVPEDFSVIGYNNSILSKCCEPMITSVDNHLDLLCSTLTNTLMNVLNKENAPLSTVFPTKLIVRGTTNSKIKE